MAQMEPRGTVSRSNRMSLQQGSLDGMMRICSPARITQRLRVLGVLLLCTLSAGAMPPAYEAWMWQRIVPELSAPVPVPRKNANAEPVLHVEILAAIPDQLILQHATAAGWINVDSAWQGPDGLYHIPLASHRPGLYRIRHSTHNEPIPLYLTENVNEIHLRTSSESILHKARLQGSNDAEVFLAASVAHDRNEELHRLEARMESISLPTAAVESFHNLVKQQDSTLNTTLDSLSRRAKSTALWALLIIMQRNVPHELDTWWPDTLLQSPELVGSPHIVARTDAYLLSFQDETFTRAQQDSAYGRAIQALAKRPMHPSMALWLRNQIVYSLSGTSYEALADSVLSNPFGPLPATPTPANDKPGFPSPKTLSKLQIQSIDGSRSPLIAQESRHTLIVFWSIWCPHCQTMLPQLWDWYTKQPEGRVNVRAISTDTPSDSLKDYIRNRRWKWLNAIDAESPHDLQSSQFGSDGVPELYLFDKLGNLISHPATLQQLINEPMQ